MTIKYYSNNNLFKINISILDTNFENASVPARITISNLNCTMETILQVPMVRYMMFMWSTEFF